jgi:acyl-homoserine lactone acylase PvdQ
MVTGCGGPSEPEPTTADAPAAPTPAAQPAQPTAEPPPLPVLEEDADTSPAPEPATDVPKPTEDVTIYRDTWGVPHIYARNESAAAFGLGYAVAEDRLEDLCRNIRTATGTMAEVFGEAHVNTDYMMKLAKNAELSEKLWPAMPEHLTSLGDSYFAGIKAYIAEHPEKLPDWAPELHSWQAAAVGRAMILRWPIGTIFDDMKNKDEAPGFGSNGWAVAPSRSADGCSIVLTDPHLGWEGMAVFYEARVFGGDLALCGFFLVGSPLMALGHNANVGWACTTGGPDTSDCYMLKLNPENPLQYEYDGEWLAAEISQIEVAVKDKDPVSRMAADTVWGPLMAEPDLENHIAYVGASPYFEDEAITGLYEQMYRMCTAKNCDEFYQALGMNCFMEQNLTFGDTEGNIQYVRTGRTPVRPEGYNWNAPVPGNTSAAKWLGIHPIEDLVQVKNPPQGYFQNCNVSPSVMMVDSPLKPEDYPDYIWNVSWDKQNRRGERSTAVLDADDSITKEEAKALALDVFDIRGETWQGILQRSVEAAGDARLKEDESLATAVDQMLAWDRIYKPDAKGAPLFEPWRLAVQEEMDIVRVIQEENLTDEEYAQLLDLLAKKVVEYEKKYGPIADMTWGTMHKVGRGGKYFPSPGADYGGGPDKINQTETLFDVRSTPNEDGLHIADNGSMATILMFFHPEGVDSYSVIPWGQSADPESPHYVDQGEHLYSKPAFKPTWFKKEDLLKNVESEKVLKKQ